MKRIQLLNYLQIIILVFLASCKEDVEPSIPETLVVNAGEDQEVTIQSEVLLNGEVEGANTNLQYLWTFKSKPEGSQASLVNSDKPAANFTPDIPGTYQLNFKVSKGSLTAEDDLTVVAADEGTSGPVEPDNQVSANINEDVVWIDKYEDPVIPDYIVTKEIVINAKLTINPGVVVHFEEDAGFKVNGVIDAKGES